MRAGKTMRTKPNDDCGGHLMEYGMPPQVYNRMVSQLGGQKTETDVFASGDALQLRKCTRQWHKGTLRGQSIWVEGLGAHVLARCSRRHHTYGEQDYCG